MPHSVLDRRLQPRIAPAKEPLEPSMADRLERVMSPGVPPLQLFMILARDRRLFSRFMNGGLLDPGHLTLRQREIVILRTTSLCGSDYEWGVHVARFARGAGLSESELEAIASGSIMTGFSADERALLQCSAELFSSCTLSDELYGVLQRHFSDEAIIEIIMLNGFYRTVSYLTNALQLPMEPQTRPIRTSGALGT